MEESYGYKEEYVEINGLKHYFLNYTVEGDKPVILYLHGGPGSSESLLAPQMTAYQNGMFNMVYYDQRGAGRTYGENPEATATYHLLYTDLEFIVDYVKDKYNVDKIYIMGHAWGSVLGLKYIKQHAADVAGYIGAGQIVDMQNITSVRCARLKELIEAGGSIVEKMKFHSLEKKVNGTFSRENLTKETLNKLNALLQKYSLVSSADKVIMKKLTRSPFYQMTDLKYLMNGQRSSVAVIEYLWNVNFFEEDMTYDVPVCFISGNWDFQTPYTQVKDYEDRITAPVKKMIIMEDAGHYAMYDQPEEFWIKVNDFVQSIEAK